MSDGKYSAFVVALSKLCGLPRKEVDAIWEGVKANAKRLDKCDHPHEFEIVDEKKVIRKAKCRKCGGVIEVTNMRWYMDGLEHATKAHAGGEK